jgi:hypothetical protein
MSLGRWIVFLERAEPRRAQQLMFSVCVLDDGVQTRTVVRFALRAPTQLDKPSCRRQQQKGVRQDLVEVARMGHLAQARSWLISCQEHTIPDTAAVPISRG